MLLAGAAVVGLGVSGVAPALAQTLPDALASAYNTNPQLNSARAQLRAVDENVPQALAGYRPQVSATMSAAATTSYATGGPQYVRGNYNSNPVAITLQLTQPLFTGFQTQNSVSQAESAVRAQRESLRNTEQSVLLNAVTAFMDVIQATSIVALQESNLSFMDEQVRSNRDRFEVGEGTRTDVAQAEANQADAVAKVAAAKANLEAAKATFRQVIGLDPKKPIMRDLSGKLMPKSVETAQKSGQKKHPAILSSTFNVDVAAFNVKVLEGQSLPTVNLGAGVGTTFAPTSPSGAGRLDSATVSLNLSVPLYTGGQISSQVRQAKEDLGYARTQVDLVRDQVRAQIISSWGGLMAAQAQIAAARSSVVANQLALEGTIEEQKVGQRTTLDVLNAQTALVNSRMLLVQAERDSVVAGYTLLASMGQLDAENLKLPVQVYNSTAHYKDVRDSWGGMRTPDGR